MTDWKEIYNRAEDRHSKMLKELIAEIEEAHTSLAQPRNDIVTDWEAIYDRAEDRHSKMLKELIAEIEEAHTSS